LVGKPEGKGPVGRPRRRWEDNSETGLRAVGRTAWTELIWLGIRTSGGLLSVR
jgi:hypothetical protein